MITIARNGSPIGIWTEEEIGRYYREGLLVDTDYFWKEGMSDWLPVAQFIRPPPPHPESMNCVLNQQAEASPDQSSSPRRTLDSDGINRLQFAGAVVLVFVGATTILWLLKPDQGSHSHDPTGPVISLIGVAILIVLGALRLHNIGYSGWWSLLMLIPFVNLIVYGICFFSPTGQAEQERKWSSEVKREQMRFRKEAQAVSKNTGEIVS